MAENKNGIFFFDEEVPAIDDFQYGDKVTGSENKLNNGRIRPDDVTLFRYISDIDLSEKCTSDGKNIGQLLSGCVKG